MVVEWWHLVVAAAAVALIVWGIRSARHPALAVLAVALLLISGFLLYTLVLTEPYLESDLNGRLDDAAMIGIPALLGGFLGFLAIRHRRSHAR